MKKIMCFILCTALLFGAYIAGYQILRTRNEYQSGESVYSELQELVREPDPTPSDALENDNPSQSDTGLVLPSFDFTGLQSINDDVVGWIQIENCGIDYPIVQGEDNDYYLKHLFDKTYNSSGCIFLDYRCSPDFSDRNSVIFGHHMKNGTMFHGLELYKKQAFYDEHPTYLMHTLQANYTIEIFAGYVANLQDDAWRVTFADDADFAAWIDERIEQSMIQCNLTPSYEDRIATLSTCSYEFDNARFVLFGVIRTGI